MAQQYSMNIGSQGIEQDRSCDMIGFDNVNEDVSKIGRDVPQDMPAPLEDATIRTSNSQEISMGPSAGDITMRTRNG
jgi:hypothetical protein